MYEFLRELIVGRPWSQPFFERLLRTCLAGASLLGAGADMETNGEARVVRSILEAKGGPYTVIEGGAQGGDYIRLIKQIVRGGRPSMHSSRHRKPIRPSRG